jgi:hypothetical protein
VAGDLGLQGLDLLRRLTRNPHAAFRDGQLLAISTLVEARRRVLCVQRTGWGKSAVYFIATALLRERGSGPTLLISPLLALMRNQIAAARDIGIEARTVNSSNPLVARWRPEPPPEWIAAVPSLRRPVLVPEFAERLAAALELPFVAVVAKTRHTAPQKSMENSAQQADNVIGAFEIRQELVRPDPLLLVDDVRDSGWTMTVVADLLREAGSGPVHPLVLAVAGGRG